MIAVTAGIVMLIVIFKNAVYWARIQQVFTAQEAVKIMVLTSVAWVLVLWGVIFW